MIANVANKTCRELTSSVSIIMSDKSDRYNSARNDRPKGLFLPDSKSSVSICVASFSRRNLRLKITHFRI
jgi:hypothetical protein